MRKLMRYYSRLKPIQNRTHLIERVVSCCHLRRELTRINLKSLYLSNSVLPAICLTLCVLLVRLMDGLTEGWVN